MTPRRRSTSRARTAEARLHGRRRAAPPADQPRRPRARAAARERGAVPPAGRGGEGLRDLHARPEGPGRDLERRARSGSRATRPREIIGQHFSEFYPSDDVRAGKCERELEGAARDGRFEDEGWRIRKDGTRFWANVVITALRDESGELVGFAKVTRDLTERRRLELEQLRLGQARGGDPAARRVPVAGGARAEDAAHGAAAAARHAARPHGSVGTSGSRPSCSAPPQSSERLAQPGRIAARRLAHRDRPLRAEARGYRHRRLRHPRGRWAAPARRARPLRAVVDADGPIVGAWDRLRLEQALTNLLANAIKYGAGKPIQVAVRQRRRRGRARGPRPRSRHPRGEQDRIFERFERGRVDSQLRRPRPGPVSFQAIVEATWRIGGRGERGRRRRPLHGHLAAARLLRRRGAAAAADFN